MEATSNASGDFGAWAEAAKASTKLTVTMAMTAAADLVFISAKEQQDAFAFVIRSSIRGQFDLTDILYQFDK